MPEKTGLPYASKVTQTGPGRQGHPVMHACGHDTHITALVGTARRLAAMKDRWKGTVVFIVQPAEERVGGAKAMLADGLYTRFPKPDYALAFHVAADIADGQGHRVGGAAIFVGRQHRHHGPRHRRARRLGAQGQGPGLYRLADRRRAAVDRQPRDRPARARRGHRRLVPCRAPSTTSSPTAPTCRSRSAPTMKRRARKSSPRIERIAKGVARANGMPEDKLPVVKVSEGTPTTINDARARPAPQRRARPRPRARRGRAVRAERHGGGGLRLFRRVRSLACRAIISRSAARRRRRSRPRRRAARRCRRTIRRCSRSRPSRPITLGTEAMVVATLELLKR